MAAVLNMPSHTTNPAYDGMKERILNFLGAGISAEKVASAVGCEPSYISQLLADEQFAAAVSTQKILQLTELTDRDKKLDALEDKVITKVEQSLASPIALLKPMEGIRALQMLNSLKRRGSVVDNNLNVNQTVVNITLPSITLKQFTMDVNNQVIKADDDSLVTIASGQVENLASDLLTTVIEHDTVQPTPAETQQTRKPIHELTISDLE